jgi:uncharacterized protein (UPF0332 family)
MSFNWRQYVSLAEEMSARTEESALRSSISRAYYGAFCLSRNYLSGNNKIPTLRPHDPPGKIHQLAIEYFDQSDDSDEFNAGQLLGELRKKRNFADYDGSYYIEKEAVGKLVAKAKEVIKIIDSLES